MGRAAHGKVHDACGGQILTDNHQLGRVASVDLVAHSLAQCVGGLGGAWLADDFAGPQLSAWWGVGAGLLAWVGIGALLRLAPQNCLSPRDP